MKNKKRISSLIVASTMLISSVSMAADFDITNKTTNEVSDILTWSEDSGLLLGIAENSSNYLIEVDKKLYDVNKVLAAMEAAPEKTIEEAVQNIAPVGNADNEFKVESISAVNGKITVALDEAPKKDLVPSDFKIQQAIVLEEGTAPIPVTVEATAVTKISDKVFELTVPKVNSETYKQTVTYSVAYGSTASKTADSFVVDALITDLKVESVSAINASELVVTFNTDVEKVSAQKADNYQLKINNVDVATADIVDIQAKGNKATLLLDPSVSFQSGDKYVIQTNDAIKSKDGIVAEKYVSNEKIFDESAAPKLKSVNIGLNGLRLEFDRPVDSISNPDLTLVKIDGEAISSKDLKPVINKPGSPDILGEAGYYIYDLALNSNEMDKATQVGTHEVVIYDIKDTATAYAGVASVLTGEYKVTDEVDAPQVTEVEAMNANRFFLYTNTPVSLANAKLTVEKGNHEFATAGNLDNDTIDASTSGVDAVAGRHPVNNRPGVFVIVTDESVGGDENPLYKGSETTATLKVTLENYTASGLVGQKSVKTVVLNKNNAKPEVKETSIDTAAKELKLTFKNTLANLMNGSLNLNNNDIVVRDNEGIIVAPTSVNVSGDTVAITLSKVDDAPYTVEFKEDKFKNKEEVSSVSRYLVNTVKNDKITTTVESKETNFKYTQFAFATSAEISAANVNAKGKYFVADNEITFSYGVDMSDSARNVSNYMLDGKPLPAGSTADFVGNKKVVRIALPKGTLKSSTDYKFGIKTDVTTAAGSHIVGSLQTKAPVEKVITLKDNIKPELKVGQFLRSDETVKPSSVSNKIEIDFDEQLQSIPTGHNNAKVINDFKVTVNGSEIKIVKVEQVSDKSERLILTLDQDININQVATVSIVPEELQNGDKEIAIKDLAGNKASTEKSITISSSKYSATYETEVNQAAAQEVIDDISNLGSATSTNYARNVAEARISYRDLTQAQKDIVDANGANNTLDNAAPTITTQAQLDALTAGATAQNQQLFIGSDLTLDARGGTTNLTATNLKVDGDLKLKEIPGTHDITLNNVTVTGALINQ